MHQLNKNNKNIINEEFNEEIKKSSRTSIESSIDTTSIGKTFCEKLLKKNLLEIKEK